MEPARRSGATITVDPGLLAEVQRHGKLDPVCLNCGGCSAVCELTFGDVTFPRRSIRQVVLGLREPVLAGLEPWLCHDCGDCTITCPRHADPAEAMRTLRRYLTGQYDATGLAARILRSRAWHGGSLLFVGLLVLAIALVYHLRWAGLGVSDLTTPMGLEHMFGKIVWFTGIVYAIPVLFLVVHVGRMFRLTMGRDRPAPRFFLAEAWRLLVEVVTHRQLRKCPAEARAAHAYERWLQHEAEGGASVHGLERVPHRWLKHWLMALGCVVFAVLTAFFLPWFQTDAVHPVTHPQRWLGYLATAFILWGTSDVLLRRFRRRKDPPELRKRLVLPLLLWLTAVSGLLVHVLRLAGLGLSAHVAYAIHLAIVVPMVVVEVPFGEWAHMIDRPLALYLQAVRERARAESRVAPAAEAGLQPAGA